MKIVSISIDDALLARAERLAAERGVSVEDMVRDLIARETGMETEDARRARMKLVELARRSHRGMVGEWNREEAYAERLSRYERPDLRGDFGDDASSEVDESRRDHGTE
jgi:hypothetical protein